MSLYKSKFGSLPGTDYKEVLRSARREYKNIQARTKRQPYVRSKYFGKDKVFINIFFNHLMQKRKGEQIKRARLFLCGVDLLRNTTLDPQTIFGKQNLNEILHRFEGITKDGDHYFVQVKQNKRTGRKDFMSVFPAKGSHKSPPGNPLVLLV